MPTRSERKSESKKNERVPRSAPGRAGLWPVLALSSALLLLAPPSARAEFSLQIGAPGISIAIQVPSYPRLIRVPGYPVYYAPQGPANYFFYDGLYWIFFDDNWYASSWYDGPWYLREPAFVPLFLLRVPVRYYRRPPAFFRGWRADEPPRWDEYWGPSWPHQRENWRQWDRRATPPPAPLPAYQQRYSGRNYPREPERQQALQAERYRFQPREPANPPLRARQPGGQLPGGQQLGDTVPRISVPPPVRSERSERPERPERAQRSERVEQQQPAAAPGPMRGAEPLRPSPPHPGAQAPAPRQPPAPQAEGGRGRPGPDRDDRRGEKREDKREDKGDDNRRH